MHGVTISSLVKMREYVGEILAGLKRERGATILALTGPLGAGKTAFVKFVAEILGVADTVTSPTFVIMKIYDLIPGAMSGFEKLVHVDAYRLEGADELRKLGWEELVKDPKNLIVIEWPELVASAVPDSAHAFVFDHIDEGTRKITRKARS